MNVMAVMDTMIIRVDSVVIDPGLGQEFSWDNGKRGPRGCLIFTLAEIR